MKRGADVNSNHHIVTAALKTKLAIGCQQFDVGRLYDPRVNCAFVLQLPSSKSSRFQALADIEDDHTQPDPEVNKKWEQIRTGYFKCREAYRGTTKHKKRKEWIKTDMWQSIKNRRVLKKKVMEAKSERPQERYKM